MKKILISFAFSLLSVVSFAQNSVGIGTIAPDTKAILDLQSTDQGVLVPRMTSAQRTAIAGLTITQNGLLIYDTDLNAFQFWNGSTWNGLGGADTDWIENNDTIYNNTHFVAIGANWTLDYVRLFVESDGVQTAIAGSSDGDGTRAIGVEGYATNSSTNIGMLAQGESATVNDTTIGMIGEADLLAGGRGIGVVGEVSEAKNDFATGVEGTVDVNVAATNGNFTGGDFSVIDDGTNNSSLGVSGDAFNNSGGTTGIAIGVYGTADGALENFAGYFADGNVHIENSLGIKAIDPISSFQLGPQFHIDTAFGGAYTLFGNNLTYNGSDFIRTRAGTGQMIFMGDEEFQVQLFSNGAAGSATGFDDTTSFKLDWDGASIRVKNEASGNYALNISGATRDGILLYSDSLGINIPSSLGFASNGNRIRITTLDNLSNSYTLTLPDGLPTSAGDVLSSDLTGKTSWITPTAGSADWTLAGNAITGGQILGTTNAQDLIIQAGGTTAMQIDDVSQNIGIGQVPSAAYKMRLLVPNTNTTTNRGIYNVQNYNGTANKEGIYNVVSADGTGAKYGVRNDVFQPAGEASALYNIYNQIEHKGTGTSYGIYNMNNGSTGSGTQTGIRNYLDNTGTGDKEGVNNYLRQGAGGNSLFAVRNSLWHDGSGIAYGVYSSFSGTGSGVQYGVYSTLSNTGTGAKHGIYNNVYQSSGSNVIRGTNNNITHNGTGTSYGVYNNNNSSNGSGNQFGVNNYINNIGTGTKYGTYNYVRQNGGASTSSQYGNFNYVNTNSTAAQTLYGAYNQIVNSSTTGQTYGNRINLSGASTGTKYGYYVSGEDLNYFSGDIDFDGRLLPNGAQGLSGQVLTSQGAADPIWTTSLNLASSGIYGGSGFLSGVTTVSQGVNNLMFNLTGTGDFLIQDAGVSMFEVRDNGQTHFGGDVFWHDINTTGATLATLIDDGNDGRFRIYENGLSTIDLDANTGAIFNEQSKDRNFRVESNNNSNMLFVDGGLDRIGIGTGVPSQELDVEGDVQIDGEYYYETSKTRYQQIPISAFNQKKVAVSSTASYLRFSTYVGGYDGESAYCYFSGGSTANAAIATAPVYLPNGAIVTALEVKWFDQNASYNASLSLETTTWGSINNTQMAVVNTSGSTTGTSGTVTGTDNTINSATINNSNNTYYVKIDSRENTSTLGFAKVRITYTVGKAD